MGIDHIVAVVAVPGQMDLPNPLRRQRTDKVPRIKAMIARADVDVINIQQQFTASQLAEGCDKFPLAELIVGGAQVAGDVFQHQRPLQHVLYLTHPCGHMLQAFFAVRQRQQVVQLVGVAAAPTQVVGDPLRLNAGRQLLEALQVVRVEGVRATDRQRHTVHDQRVVLADRVEVVQRLAALDQIILGEHLEPIDRRPVFENLLIVLTA